MNKEPDVVELVFVSDERYAPRLRVTLKSVVEQVEGGLLFHIVANGISKAEKEAIVECALGSEVLFYDVDDSFVSGLSTRCHVSVAAYYKVFLSTVLPESTRRVIYLDCDLLVCSDLTALWSLDLEGNVLGAVWDPMYTYDEILIAEGTRKFNSGVLLIDLDRMREEQGEERCVEFLNSYHDQITLHDQAVFNNVFADRWFELDYRWNVQTCFYRHVLFGRGAKREIAASLGDPFVVHFSSNKKPWQVRSGHPYKNKYIKMSIAVGVRVGEGVTFINLAKRVKEEFCYLFYRTLCRQFA